ncbi:transporter substrate-binding domain-containing protein [Bradyrhizobium stylosanthis]|uniref:Amino acid ABC transporter substrate-binding protein (PAAT family) n=1 Tax=Bradyrhizobium stylosanthis TaxID=1803665 RepID=A0A560DNM5_9BRAD|nr:transporter substrate-binding domain-containing protein [Bradyrhizobium stylosanthis]TWA98719.1 amino acid ABC transporter substrate-binding protein (PAAT family) [Bradyrhizobium stylosanthis]
MLRQGLTAALGFVFLATAAFDAKAEGPTDVAPTGTLRVAVAVGPAASAFWTTRDPSSGKPRGVTVELAKAAADRLHVPLQLVEYQSSDEIAAASGKDVWDLSFMPADVKREAFVDQGPAYVAYMSGYLVRAGSDIRTVADVDRAGMRVGCIEGTSTSRTVEKSIKQAKLTKFAKPEEAAALIGKGELDALAMGMGALEDLSRKLPGTKVLDEVIQSTGVVVVVPKGKAAAKVWAAHFLDEAKADGTVRRALDGNGFTGDKVAP